MLYAFWDIAKMLNVESNIIVNGFSFVIVCLKICYQVFFDFTKLS